MRKENIIYAGWSAMRLLILFIALYFVSCSSQTKNHLGSNFPIDSILKITKAPIDIVEIRDFDLEKLPKIDSLFFGKYLEGMPIQGADTQKLRFNDEAYWYFVDHRDLGDRILFSVLSDNESGYSVLYYLLCDKSSKDILSVNALASLEGDGGYWAVDSLVWTGNKFTCYTISGELEEEHDSLLIQSRDSSCRVYVLSDKKFTASTVYSYSIKDTIELQDAMLEIDDEEN